jgi:hypothetical protein
LSFTSLMSRADGTGVYSLVLDFLCQSLILINILVMQFLAIVSIFVNDETN